MISIICSSWGDRVFFQPTWPWLKSGHMPLCTHSHTLSLRGVTIAWVTQSCPGNTFTRNEGRHPEFKNSYLHTSFCFEFSPCELGGDVTPVHCSGAQQCPSSWASGVLGIIPPNQLIPGKMKRREAKHFAGSHIPMGPGSCLWAPAADFCHPSLTEVQSP